MEELRSVNYLELLAIPELCNKNFFIPDLVKSEQAHPLGDGKNRSPEAKNGRNRAEKTEYIRSTVAKTS